MGKTSSAVKDRWNAKAYDEIKLRVQKGQKAQIQNAAAAAGMSLNAYITAAITEKISQDSADL